MAETQAWIRHIALQAADACANGRASPIELLPGGLYYTVQIDGDDVVVADRAGGGFDVRPQIEELAGVALHELGEPAVPGLRRLAWTSEQATRAMKRLQA